jgi:translation elongation factor EF-Tu-like GTPase
VKYAADHRPDPGSPASIEGVSDDHLPFRFRVTAVFTITGRGLMAAGLTEQGEVRTGDELVVHHGQARTTATCRGIEMIRTNGSVDIRTVGLLLTALTKDDVAEGDIILGA